MMSPANDQSRTAYRSPSSRLDRVRPSLISAAARVILRDTNGSGRRSDSWLYRIPEQAKTPVVGAQLADQLVGGELRGRIRVSRAARGCPRSGGSPERRRTSRLTRRRRRACGRMLAHGVEQRRGRTSDRRQLRPGAPTSRARTTAPRGDRARPAPRPRPRQALGIERIAVHQLIRREGARSESERSSPSAPDHPGHRVASSSSSARNEPSCPVMPVTSARRGRLAYAAHVLSRRRA